MQSLQLKISSHFEEPKKYQKHEIQNCLEVQAVEVGTFHYHLDATRARIFLRPPTLASHSFTFL